MKETLQLSQMSIAQLIELVRELFARVEKLEFENTQLREVIEVLRLENKQLKIENAKLKMENAQLKIENTHLKQELAQLKKSRSSQR